MLIGWLAGLAVGSGWWMSRPHPPGGAATRRDVGQLLHTAKGRAAGAARPVPARSGRFVGVVSAAFVAGLGAYAAAGLLVAVAMSSAVAFVALRVVMSGGVGPWPARALSRRRPVGAGRTLPAALDLLAACLSAGAAPAQALEAVGGAFDGEVGAMLTAVGRLVLLGAPVETAWSGCLADADWAPVARAVIRAHYSGAALTDVLVHVADDRRRALRTDAQAAAQRAGIRAVLPLGACFLPAFVLVGVVPVVAGFAHALWS